jgi:hypothetical protein
MVGVFTGKGTLGAVLARDLELQRCELGFHFLVSLGDFGAVHGGAALIPAVILDKNVTVLDFYGEGCDGFVGGSG